MQIIIELKKNASTNITLIVCIHEWLICPCVFVFGVLVVLVSLHMFTCRNEQATKSLWEGTCKDGSRARCVCRLPISILVYTVKLQFIFLLVNIARIMMQWSSALLCINKHWCVSSTGMILYVYMKTWRGSKKNMGWNLQR